MFKYDVMSLRYMGIIRKDYILDHYVIYSEERGKRPYEFRMVQETPPKIDYFAAGNEHLTPPEIGRVNQGSKWAIRWFPNKFSSVSGDDTRKFKTSRFLNEMPAYGFQEVIAETPSKTKQLWDFKANEIYSLLKVYGNRTRFLREKKGIRYVQIFKNHGRDAGTSIMHSHTQVIALPIIPPLIKEKLKALKDSKIEYQDIVQNERKSERKVFETKNFLAFCPFASRFSYELWIFPIKFIEGIDKMDDSELLDLSKMMEKILKKLKDLGCSFNFYLNYSPKTKGFPFHIEITPRINSWAGFELSTGIILNPVMPEKAAKYYRG
jgi:UDPglucose--hexose-1-phosphate uridylyltransferase